MIRDLIELANHLDKIGQTEEADTIDRIISSAAKKKKKDKKWPDWNGFGMPPWFKKRKKKNDARDSEYSSELLEDNDETII